MAVPFEFKPSEGGNEGVVSRRLMRRIKHVLCRPQWRYRKGWRPEPLTLEPLEPRLLLNADLTLDVTGGNAGDELIVRVDSVDLANDGLDEDVAAIQVLRVENDDSETVLDEGALGPNNTISLITGSGADTVTFEAGDVQLPATVLAIDLTVALGGGGDRLIVDSTKLGSILGSQLTATVDADFEGGSSDALEFSGGFDVAFVVDASGGGTADDTVVSVAFSDVENLKGGTADDTFSFDTGGLILGIVDGNDGDDRVRGPDIAATIAVTGDGTGTLKKGARGSSLTTQATFANVEILQGGDAEAVLDMSAIGSGVAVDLGAQTADINPSSDDGTEYTVYDFDVVVGTSGDDNLVGSANDDILVSNGGDDTLEGSQGDDSYEFDATIGDVTVVENSEALQGEIDTFDLSALANSFRVSVLADLSLLFEEVTVAGNKAVTAVNNGFSIAANSIENILGGLGAFNIVDFSALDSTVNVDLATGQATLFGKTDRVQLRCWFSDWGEYAARR